MSDQREGGIGWTDQTWNPVRGCSRVSPGCEHCYAETMAGRFGGKGQPYEGLVRMKVTQYDDGAGVEPTRREARWTGAVRLVPKHLADPLRWKRQRRVFVNSMSDLFHEGLSNEEIAAVFGVMAASPEHTFQVLTKRAERMRDWFAWVAETAVHAWDLVLLRAADKMGHALFEKHVSPERFVECEPWPLPNVWLGVSVEDQRRADERIPLLLETPASVRFVSAEPLLGILYMVPWLAGIPTRGRITADGSLHDNPSPALDWVIAGCESGPGARPTYPDWYRFLRDQCQAASVPFFLKQATAARSGIFAGPGSTTKAGGVIAAPYLDGRQWLEFPR